MPLTFFRILDGNYFSWRLLSVGFPEVAMDGDWRKKIAPYQVTQSETRQL